MKNKGYRFRRHLIISVMVLVPLPGMRLLAAHPVPQAAPASEDAFLWRAGQLADLNNFLGSLDQLSEISTSQIPLSESETQKYLLLLGQAYYNTSDPRCLETLDEFLLSYPYSGPARDVRILKGDFFFFARDYSRALECYKLISFPDNLTECRLGISLIRRGFYSEARPIFNNLARKKSYSTLALYYNSYLDYVASDDISALQGFDKVEQQLKNSSARFPRVDDITVDSRRLYPEYYIAQLYFRNGKWSEAESKARRILRSKNSLPLDSQLESGTLRVLGMSLYEQGKYKEAGDYLRRYIAVVGTDATDDSLYALGVSEYEAGEYEEAASRFATLLDSRDAIAQGSYLFLGQIEAHEGNPSAAAINFEKAYRMNFDNKVAETALYNYAAACSNGGNIPFDSSRELLEIFLENYPDSEYAPAVERYMASAYYQRGDYENALKVASRIALPTPADRRMHQAILYAAGASAVSEGAPQKAASLLRQCISLKGGAPEVSAQANLWLGDALYADADYAAATKAYMAALNSGHLDSNRDLLLYDLGYSLFMQKKYAEAAKYFATASSANSLSADLRRDASLRAADCLYYQGDYDAAATQFARMMQSGRGADYATYRHAQIIGMRGDTEGKISELKSMMRQFSSSSLMPKAMSELADTYASQGRHAEASEIYNSLLTRYPVSPDSPKAMLGLANSRMAAGETAEAIATYRRLMSTYPSSSQARLADKELRQYYADHQLLSEYTTFLKSIPGFSIDAAELDDLAFGAARTAILSAERPDATPMRKYLADYPSGRNVAEGWSLYADWLYDNGTPPEALKAYEELERRGGSDYEIEAYTGIMRTADNRAVRLEYARKLMDIGGVPSSILEEARLVEARELLADADASLKRRGRATLQDIASNPFTAAGAEAAVLLAEDMLAEGDVKGAIKAMEDFTSSGSTQQYWVARGFITLADAYTASGKDYLAKEYLRSLKDNYPGDEEDIQRMLDKRLNK